MKIDLLIAEKLIETLKEKQLTLATAESCTGGGIGYTLTGVSGSSAVYMGGIISYANIVKEQLLGVPEDTLKQHGAVSKETALAMAKGVRAQIGADLAVSVTGIAGPKSDDTNKPVGLVYICADNGTKCHTKEERFRGNRDEVRSQTINSALSLVLELICED